LLQLRQASANVIDVAYSITAKDELRQVMNTIKLAREISSEVLN
jgi:predicted nucleic acid-binding protein